LTVITFEILFEKKKMFYNIDSRGKWSSQGINRFGGSSQHLNDDDRSARSGRLIKQVDPALSPPSPRTAATLERQVSSPTGPSSRITPARQLSHESIQVGPIFSNPGANPTIF
jgi:hypothetical protein